MLSRQNLPRVLLLLTLASLLVFLPFSNPQPGFAQTVNGIDLIIAIDNSASMDSPLSGDGFQSIDPETWVSWGSYAGFERPASDPDGLRFTATASIIRYLADATKRDNLTAYVSVVQFANTADATPWTEVTASGAVDKLLSGSASPAVGDGTATAKPTSAPSKNTLRTSNYTDLYAKVADLLRNRPAGEQSRRAILYIVTDGASCIPSAPVPCKGYADAARQVRDAADTVPNSVNLIQDIFYLQLAQPPSNQTQWSKAVKFIQNTFEGVAKQRGKVVTLEGTDSVKLISSQMFETTLNELATVKGVPSDNAIATGITKIANQTFTVPFYQNELTLYAFLEGESTDLLITADGQSITPTVGDANGRIKVLHFKNPAPGIWKLSTSRGNVSAWATYTGAVASVHIEPPNPSQFESFKVVYELKDVDSKPYTQTDKPDFTVSVQVDGKSIPLQMTEEASGDGQRFASYPFFPMKSGTLSVRFAVNPVSSWDKISTNYSFLTPANSATIPVTVGATTFKIGFGTGSEARNGMPTVKIPRSLTLPVTVTSDKDVLPAKLDAVLSFSNTKDQTCPLTDDVTIPYVDKAATIKTDLKFPSQGACIVSLEIKTTNSLEPSPGEKVLYEKQPIGEVQVATTALLNLELIGGDGAIVPQPNTGDAAHFTMTNVLWQPVFFKGSVVRWDDDTLNIEVLFRDNDSKQPASPKFTSQVSAPTAAKDSEKSADGKSTDGKGADSTSQAASQTYSCAAADTPLQLSITQVGGSGADEAEPRGIRLCPSPREGYYVATIKGLTPADYEVQVKVQKTPALDNQINEYAPALQAENYALKGRLHVNRNWTVIGQQAGAALVIALVTLIIAAAGFNRGRNIMFKLSGDLVIYMKDSSGKTTILWRTALPANLAEHVVPATDLIADGLISNLPVDYVRATTKNRKSVADRKSAFITVKIGDTTLINDKEIRQNDPVEIQDNNTVKFYIVKLPTGGTLQ